MKSHELAKQLLAGPDLPIFHFDPSRAAMDPDRDTTVTEPKIETNDYPCEDRGPDSKEPGAFITICGDGDVDDEPGAVAEKKIAAIAELIPQLQFTDWSGDEMPPHNKSLRKLRDILGLPSVAISDTVGHGDPSEP